MDGAGLLEVCQKLERCEFTSCETRRVARPDPDTTMEQCSGSQSSSSCQDSCFTATCSGSTLLDSILTSALHTSFVEDSLDSQQPSNVPSTGTTVEGGGHGEQSPPRHGSLAAHRPSCLVSPTGSTASQLARQVSKRVLREHSEVALMQTPTTTCLRSKSTHLEQAVPSSITKSRAETSRANNDAPGSASFSTSSSTALPDLNPALLTSAGLTSEALPPSPASSFAPSFVPREVPADGLLHLSPSAHPGMRRDAWSASDYSITRKIYAGYASTVCKATCLRSGQDVVLKAYTLSSLSDFLRNQVLRELDIHSRLNYPGVVQLLAAFREGDALVMVLEYVRGGSLDRARRKLGGRMTEQQALELVMVPLLRTLHYMHTQSIVHRDIKPENLLFTPDWRLKVCDYGVSICLEEERAVTRTGSRDYMSPEVNVCPLKRTPGCNKDSNKLAYGTAADVWSLGALAYELLVGFTPFPGGPATIRKTDPSKALPFPSSVSAEARLFVRTCLEVDPADRPTVQQLLAHRWVLEGTQRAASA